MSDSNYPFPPIEPLSSSSNEDQADEFPSADDGTRKPVENSNLSGAVASTGRDPLGISNKSNTPHVAASARNDGYVSYSSDDTSDTVMWFSGQSWVITRKDVRTGTIERFTQSGTSALGRLEIVQGKGANIPNNAPLPDSLGPLQRDTLGWIGVEDRGPVQLSSRKLIPLPQNMRRAISGAMFVEAPSPPGHALGDLLPPPVREEMNRESQALVDKLNGKAPSQPASPKARSPVPAPH